MKNVTKNGCFLELRLKAMRSLKGRAKDSKKILDEI
jgi:hypothetical protein